MENITEELQDSKGKNWTWTHASRRRYTEANFEKIIQNKTVGTLQD